MKHYHKSIVNVADRSRGLACRDLRTPMLLAAGLSTSLNALAGGIPVADWSETDFLFLFVPALLAGLGFAVFRQLAWKRRLIEETEAQGSPADPYQIAALQGGTTRIAQAAIISLARRGAVLLGGSDGKQLQLNDPLPGNAHEVEHTAYQLLFTLQPVRVLEAVQKIAAAPEIQKIAWSAVPEGSDKVPTPSRWDGLLLNVVLIAGLAKLGIQFLRGDSFTNLAIAVGVGTVARVVRSMTAKPGIPLRQRIVARLKEARSDLREPTDDARGLGRSPEEWAAAVGLFGPRALTSSVFNDYIPLLGIELNDAG
jgi:uncharacterized protein (TIGR04222 family)